MRKTQTRERKRHKNASVVRPFATLTDGIFGNIYQAITGNVHIPAHFVRRAIANGLPAAELQDAIRSAKTVRALPDYLLAASEQKLERALYWDELGLKARARDLYLDSTLWGLYAEQLIDDEDKRQLVWRKYRESYRRAAPYFAHPAEEVSIHYLASTVSGYFRAPVQQEADAEYFSSRTPVVILLNGLFSAREEFHFLENSLLSQGFATLSVDYPGTVSHSAQVPTSFDVKELANSLYMHLSARPDVDCSRITLYGQSLGGRLALQMALAFPERFQSIVSMSTPLDLLSNLDRLVPVFGREHMVSPLAARASLYEFGLHTQIEQNIQHIEAPLLVLGGGKDKVVHADQTRQIYDRSFSADKKLILCPGAGHCLYEMMPSIRYEIAQWIKQRTASSSPLAAD